MPQTVQQIQNGIERETFATNESSQPMIGSLLIINLVRRLSCVSLNPRLHFVPCNPVRAASRINNQMPLVAARSGKGAFQGANVIAELFCSLGKRHASGVWFGCAHLSNLPPLAKPSLVKYFRNAGMPKSVGP